MSRECIVDLDNSNGSEDADMDVGTGRRVYVGNLSWKVKWQDLKDHMRSAGDVEHAIIMEVGGRSKVRHFQFTLSQAKNAPGMRNCDIRNGIRSSKRY